MPAGCQKAVMLRPGSPCKKLRFSGHPEAGSEGAAEVRPLGAAADLKLQADVHWKGGPREPG